MSHSEYMYRIPQTYKLGLVNSTAFVLQGLSRALGARLAHFGRASPRVSARRTSRSGSTRTRLLVSRTISSADFSGPLIGTISATSDLPFWHPLQGANHKPKTQPGEALRSKQGLDNLLDFCASQASREMPSVVRTADCTDAWSF